MIDRKFSCWTIVQADISFDKRWIARCECGTERSFPEHRLAKSRGLTCKCQRGRGANRSAHGMSYEPIYAIWGGMKNRCLNPNMHAYNQYGGRGIKICERWMKFENFFADMGPTYQPGLSIEREDNDGNYEPGNCRWATTKEQNRNQKSNVVIDTCRGRMLMQDAARIAGITWRAMAYRVSAGWEGERLFLPNTAHNKRKAA